MNEQCFKERFPELKDLKYKPDLYFNTSNDKVYWINLLMNYCISKKKVKDMLEIKRKSLDLFDNHDNELYKNQIAYIKALEWVLEQ